MKKTLSALLVLLFVLTAATPVVHAEAPRTIHVYDLLKYDADAETGTCRTVGITFEVQYCRLDRTKAITIRTADDAIAAECVPHDDDARMFDLYTPDGHFGAVFHPEKLYYLVIPEGAYCTEDGIPNAEYRGEYTGIYLSDKGDTYKAIDLGIVNFLAGKTEGNRLLYGKLLVSASFDTMLTGQNTVRLYKIDGENEKHIGTYSITKYKSGAAEIDFGGAKIDRYASYKLRVQYGTFRIKRTTINDHSDYILSGKKMLGLSESYPAIDFLIAAFGTDHWTLQAVCLILKALVLIQAVDKAFYNDVKAYIKARQS